MSIPSLRSADCAAVRHDDALTWPDPLSERDLTAARRRLPMARRRSTAQHTSVGYLGDLPPPIDVTLLTSAPDRADDTAKKPPGRGASVHSRAIRTDVRL